ncbi:MAG: Unknown protein [uncultured Sulfurovum sp.]|uniref:Uncharacterized protein n=1 Tax=uncultured Sulfurovum sp. TaxID=269237 RepID=A0A6S6T084_9BACT|nr:MAG: Unknown protein [uncultured Sulfurovum sp.]
MVTIEEIYYYLSFHHLNDDVKQDLAIKLWENRNKYNPEIAKASTWVSAAVKNHLISISRTTDFKENNKTSNFSKFIKEDNENFEYNLLDEILTSNEFNPENEYSRQERKEYCLELIKNLSNDIQKIVYMYSEGFTFDEIGLKLNIGKSTVYKHYQNAISELRLGTYKVYHLVNTQTKEKYKVKSFKQASNIVGCSGQSVSNAYKQNSLLKKIWRIS